MKEARSVSSVKRILRHSFIFFMIQNICELHAITTTCCICNQNTPCGVVSQYAADDEDVDGASFCATVCESRGEEWVAEWRHSKDCSLAPNDRLPEQSSPPSLSSSSSSSSSSSASSSGPMAQGGAAASEPDAVSDEAEETMIFDGELSELQNVLFGKLFLDKDCNLVEIPTIDVPGGVKTRQSKKARIESRPRFGLFESKEDDALLLMTLEPPEGDGDDGIVGTGSFGEVVRYKVHDNKPEGARAAEPFFVVVKIAQHSALHDVEFRIAYKLRMNDFFRKYPLMTKVREVNQGYTEAYYAGTPDKDAASKRGEIMVMEEMTDDLYMETQGFQFGPHSKHRVVWKYYSQVISTHFLDRRDSKTININGRAFTAAIREGQMANFMRIEPHYHYTSSQHRAVETFRRLHEEALNWIETLVDTRPENLLKNLDVVRIYRVLRLKQFAESFLASTEEREGRKVVDVHLNPAIADPLNVLLRRVPVALLRMSEDIQQQMLALNKEDEDYVYRDLKIQNVLFQRVGGYEFGVTKRVAVGDYGSCAAQLNTMVQKRVVGIPASFPGPPATTRASDPYYSEYLYPPLQKFNKEDRRENEKDKKRAMSYQLGLLLVDLFQILKVVTSPLLRGENGRLLNQLHFKNNIVKLRFGGELNRIESSREQTAELRRKFLSVQEEEAQGGELNMLDGFVSIMSETTLGLLQPQDKSGDAEVSGSSGSGGGRRSVAGGGRNVGTSGDRKFRFRKARSIEPRKLRSAMLSAGAAASSEEHPQRRDVGVGGVLRIGNLLDLLGEGKDWTDAFEGSSLSSMVSVPLCDP